GVSSRSKVWRLGCIDGAAVRVLAGLPQLARFTALRFSYTPVGLLGAEALASSSHLANLRELNLMRCGIDDAGAVALAQSPHLAALEELNLSWNDIGSAGARALASGSLSRLRRLVIERNRFRKADLAALQKRFGDGLLA